jgi:ElaB/YqjD/DUF883 family membrane-anchored ribosome-binding protein
MFSSVFRSVRRPVIRKIFSEVKEKKFPVNVNIDGFGIICVSFICYCAYDDYLKHKRRIIGDEITKLKYELNIKYGVAPDFKDEISSLNLKIRDAKCDMEKELKEITHQIDKQLEEIKCDMNKELKEIKCNMNKELKKIKCDMDKELKEIKCNMNKELKEIKCDMDKELKEIKCDMNKELKDIKCDICEESKNEVFISSDKKI